MNNIFTDTPIKKVDPKTNNESSYYDYLSIESRGIYHPEILEEPVNLLISLHDKSLKPQLLKIIEVFDISIDKYWDTKSNLPKISAMILNDMSEVVLNWTFKSLKIGISISQNKNDSIWYYALNNNRGGLSTEYGQLSNDKNYLELEKLIELAIKTNN